jgi:hypothetical protein
MWGLPRLIIEEAAMSKVIHLSDDAHAKAKAFCKEHSLKMSDWVAALIDTAIAGGNTVTAASTIANTNVQVQPQASHADESNVRALVQKKKLLEHYESSLQTAEDGLPVYAAPPFWAKAR